MKLASNAGTSSRYTLKSRKSLYSLKRASLNWHNMIKAALLDKGFVESISDQCVYNQGFDSFGVLSVWDQLNVCACVTD